MNDPRHRAPFAHSSSFVDLKGAYSTSPPRQQWPLSNGAPNGSNGSNGSNGGLAPPGYPSLTPSTEAPMSRIASAASVASNILGGMRMERNKSDMENPYDLPPPRARADSVSEGIHRVQSALPSSSTLRFVLLCFLWYTTSAVSSNTGKVILNNFKFPVTLTIVQFMFVAALCWIGSRRELNWTARLRNPTKQILLHTFPMAVFQVGGHIFGSLAISRVPVSTVHTIKALSPLFTVLAYAFLFGVSYSPATYLSLLPLTLGVMLACSFDISLSNVFGLVCAFGSTIVFVSQNIFFKKVMPSPGSSTPDHTGPRLDKINLLYFSSTMAFLLMVPIWVYTDATRFVNLWLAGESASSPSSTASVSTVLMYFVINGTVHFAQILLAFAILSSTSPVTYSIASLVKRIAVICLAIVWFKQAVHAVQAMGIALTAIGLWMYNNAKRDVDKGEKKMRAVEAAREAARDGLLPTTFSQARMMEGRETPEPYLDTKAKSSPRPAAYFPDPYAAVSKASALRTAYAPPPRKQVPVNAEPYPSPPTSTASSPPFQPSHLADEPHSPVTLTAGA